MHQYSDVPPPHYTAYGRARQLVHGLLIEHRSGLTHKQLRHLTGLSKMGVYNVLEALEDQGIVVRERGVALARVPYIYRLREVTQ